MAKVLAKYDDNGRFQRLRTVEQDPIVGGDHQYWNTTETLPDEEQLKTKEAFWKDGAWEYKDKPPEPQPPAEQQEQPQEGS